MSNNAREPGLGYMDANMAQSIVNSLASQKIVGPIAKIEVISELRSGALNPDSFILTPEFLRRNSALREDVRNYNLERRWWIKIVPFNESLGYAPPRRPHNVPDILQGIKRRALACIREFKTSVLD